MSLEGTGGNWDVGPEIREIREVSYSESSVPQAQIPEVADIESIRGYEGAEKVISVEAGQARALTDFTQEAIATTKGQTGASDLFAEDERNLMRLKAELEAVSSSGYTAEDKANAIKFGHTTLEWGGEHGTTSSRVAEQVPTIAPAEVQDNKSVLLGRAEIPVLSRQEEVLLHKAVGGIGIPKLEKMPATEIGEMIKNIETIEARELPGDEWFHMATDLLRKQGEYDTIQRPFRIEDGVRDVATGETAPIEIIASPREKFAVENPNLSLRDRADLERGFQDNPRARLEGLLLNLRKYESQNKPHASQSTTEVTGGLSEHESGEGANTTNVTGGLSMGEFSPENPPTEGRVDEVLEPESLLGLEGMATDRFFGLDREAIYNVLRRTAILPDDNPNKIKAMRILDLLEKGKSSYLEEYPDSETVSF